jgi:pentatricopeptide repeat protein
VSHERGVVRLLVNLEDAVQHGNPTWIRNLFREVLERPLQTMLEAKRAVQVGPGVAEAVGGLLRTWPSFSLTGLRREVFLLERLGAEGMPQPMMNRLQLLRKRLEREGKRKPREVLPERVETEIGRLVRLVESRACAWIGFEPGTITGVSNPYAFGADVNQRSIAFRLDMSGSSRLPDLVVWNPMLEIFRRQSCLGEAIKVFHGMEKRGDLYGMVDTLLDYFETNRVGFPVELVGFPDFEF